MNFKHLVCNTCEKEEGNDSFLIFASKNQIKNNKIEIKKKSLLSSSDNNNSTDNVLEIIEYPYNYDNTDSNDYTPEPPPPPEKPIIKKEKTFSDDDLFLLGIKPPKLFNTVVEWGGTELK